VQNTLNAQLDTQAKDLPFSRWVFSIALKVELSQIVSAWASKSGSTKTASHF